MRSSSATAPRTFTPSAGTSGPVPSPPMTATLRVPLLFTILFQSLDHSAVGSSHQRPPIYQQPQNPTSSHRRELRGPDTSAGGPGLGLYVAKPGLDGRSVWVIGPGPCQARSDQLFVEHLFAHPA